MRILLLRLAALSFSLLLGACGDIPTSSPAPDLTSASPMLSGDCTLQADGSYRCPSLQPIWDDECDQYHFDCGGDDCITSSGGEIEGAVQGCGGGGSGGSGDGGDSGDGGGGGGGGGGGPGGDPGCPDYGCDEPPPEPSLAGDMDRDTIPPEDCYNPNNSHWDKLYCFRAMPPDSSQLRKTRQALDNIAKRGEECAVVAQKGRELLTLGQITFFVIQEGDAAGYGHRNTGIQLDAAYPQWYEYPDSGFEWALVHEIDHVLGFDHIDDAGRETPHSTMCS